MLINRERKLTFLMEMNVSIVGLFPRSTFICSLERGWEIKCLMSGKIDRCAGDGRDSNYNLIFNLYLIFNLILFNI